MKADRVAMGHNADDCAETVLMNLTRGDLARLSRCSEAVTGEGGRLPRVRPLMLSYQKDIVLYAHFQRLEYFSTECIYSPNAYRGHAREFVKSLERVRPQAIIDIIYSSQHLLTTSAVPVTAPGACSRCGCMTSQPVCKACVLLEGLNKGCGAAATRSARRTRHLVRLEYDDDDDGAHVDGGGGVAAGSAGVPR
eukprot:GHVU01040790.1.p1 GENE.GHVU01040790.1~~GHVU01040790.1.p1  ORF type:complete len:219 (-),score=30.70 GHVU01040790.1:420-1001(-)